MTQLIEETEGVEAANVDLASGRAVITMKRGAKLDESALREKVDRDFKVESLVAVTH